ncbi:MAG: response regulator transcription factor [Acidobacteriia bacterium]|nr:response regulator transcription factor [Terriglobia bacterium]
MDSDRVTGSRPIRILLVDDHPAVRHGLALLLASEGMEVCGEAARRNAALAQIAKIQPDMAIVDLSLDGEDGVTLIDDLRQRHIPVLAYSMHNDPTHVAGAFAAGALGYVTKRELDSVLMRAIRAVAAGRRFVSADAAVALAEGIKGPAPCDGFDKLSLQEREVYQLLGRGESASEAALALHVSTRTVESYCARMQVKLSLDSMHELRRHAIDYFQKHPR